LQPRRTSSFRIAWGGRDQGSESWRDASDGDGTGDARWDGIAMKDILFILVTVSFFGLAWLYARSCEKI